MKLLTCALLLASILKLFLANPASASSEEESQACDYARNLFTPANSYLKTMCWITTPVTYSNADAFCTGINMTLFALTSADDLAALAAACDEKLGTDTGSAVWLNGKQSQDGKWSVFVPEQRPLASAAWPSSEFVDSASYLTFSNDGGSFRTAGSFHDASLTFICEFNSTGSGSDSTTAASSSTSATEATSSTSTTSTETTTSGGDEAFECPKCLLNGDGPVGVIASCALAPKVPPAKEAACTSGTLINCNGLANVGVVPSAKRCCCARA